MSIKEIFYKNDTTSMKIRSMLQKIFFKIFRLGTYFGIQIMPVHYYSPIPNIIELQKTKNIWAKKSKMPGVSFNLNNQLKNIIRICTKYKEEYIGNKNFREAVLKHFGTGYGYLEAQALHSIIRFYHPKKIIEIGSGVSTYCIFKAMQLNNLEGHHCKLTCIEPYPSKSLKKLKDINLITQKVQTISPELFKKLGKGDLLFIDSSHTIKPGGDVNFLILEVLPLLRKGVIVHFHDIYFPYDYQYSVLSTLFHWSETSLLRALLIFNNRAEIFFSMSALHHERKQQLKKLFPEYNSSIDKQGICEPDQQPHANFCRHFPTSTYIKIK